MPDGLRRYKGQVVHGAPAAIFTRRYREPCLKDVAFYLCFAGPAGETCRWESYATIAAATGWDERTVQVAVKTMKDDEMIHVARQKWGGRSRPVVVLWYLWRLPDAMEDVVIEGVEDGRTPRARDFAPSPIPGPRRRRGAAACAPEGAAACAPEGAAACAENPDATPSGAAACASKAQPPAPGAATILFECCSNGEQRTLTFERERDHPPPDPDKAPAAVAWTEAERDRRIKDDLAALPPTDRAGLRARALAGRPGLARLAESYVEAAMCGLLGADEQKYPHAAEAPPPPARAPANPPPPTFRTETARRIYGLTDPAAIDSLVLDSTAELRDTGSPKMHRKLLRALAASADPRHRRNAALRFDEAYLALREPDRHRLPKGCPNAAAMWTEYVRIEILGEQRKPPARGPFGERPGRTAEQQGSRPRPDPN